MAQSESTLPLVIAGTLAVHLIVAVVIDVASVVGRDEDQREITKLSLVDIKTLPKPPEPPPVEDVVDVDEPPPTDVPPPPRQIRTPRASKTTQPVKTDTPPTPSIEPPPGGAPVVTLPGIAPAARGVAAASGQPKRGRVGRGGTGTGSGSGSGAGDGSGSGPPVIATSVASIKTPAEAKEGFDYFDARKSYPAEAKRLGVEGKLRVRLVVDAKGKVTQAKLLGSLGHGLDELALARARAIEFEPAKDSDDKPVASVVVWTFTFTLPSDT